MRTLCCIVCLQKLAPKLKGRKRRKKFSRQESVESVDSDLGADKLVAMTADDVQFKPTVSGVSLSLQPRCTLDIVMDPFWLQCLLLFSTAVPRLVVTGTVCDCDKP